jgi:7-cyano-7-deazaguanine synthase in queuosine biosynthesis
MKHKPVHALVTWSGGIDSTALVAQMLDQGFKVTLLTLRIYGEQFGQRESAARIRLFPVLKRIGEHQTNRGRGIIHHYDQRADWLWSFSPDGIEIPNRNKRILDYLVTMAQGLGITHIGMGEYIGADSWVVSDHVGAADADARSLAAYLYHEYGLGYRLWTLADFGESRYKADRLLLGTEVIGRDMTLTSNCLLNYREHCGRCYKCIERAAAFHLSGITDTTFYIADPTERQAFQVYCEQMKGLPVSVSWHDESMQRAPMPTRAGDGD